jgi:hypothetical protein
MRKGREYVLIGNAGIGKSALQYLYLFYMLHPTLFAELGPNFRNSKRPPEVVIRRVGNRFTEVYLMKEKKSYQVKMSEHHFDVLHAFDIRKTLYMLEPYHSRIGSSDWLYEAFSFLSPDTSRFKETVEKGSAAEFFMPTWKEEEIFAVYDYFKKQKHFEHTDDLKQLYEESAFKDRFYKFGGIFKHVFVNNKMRLNDFAENQEANILNIDVKRLLAAKSLEDDKISGYVMKYDVGFSLSNSMSFSRSQSTLKFVSEEVELKCTEILRNLSISKKVEYMMRGESMDFAIRVYFEELVLKAISRRRKMFQKSNPVSLREAPREIVNDSSNESKDVSVRSFTFD